MGPARGQTCAGLGSVDDLTVARYAHTAAVTAHRNVASSISFDRGFGERVIRHMSDGDRAGGHLTRARNRHSETREARPPKRCRS